MSRWLKMGLTDKLFIPFVCILLLSVLATTISTLLVQERTDTEKAQQYTGRMKGMWRLTAHSLWTHGEVDELKQVFREAADLDTMLLSVTLYNSRGMVVATSSGDGNPVVSAGLQIVTPVSGPNGENGRLIVCYVERITERTTLGLVTAIVLTGLITIVLGAIVYMKVLDLVLLRRIRLAGEAATAIAAHDLGLRLDDHGEDELAALAGAFNKMADNLSDLIRGIQQVVSDVDAKAGGIMTAVESQSTLSTTQSEQVSQITSSMSEMADQARRIASTSQDVVHIADETRRSSDLGVSATDESRGLMDQIARGNNERVDQINELKRRATQIGDVMEFIEQIADQTKLIAFNASIEAAGAGEMGRRFEVVAREIRRLAENVSESAGQIRTRIIDIQQAIGQLASTSIEESDKVRQGSDAALHTVTVLHNIRDGAFKTNTRIQEISDAIANQDNASRSLLQGLQSIDRNALQLKKELGDLVGIASALKGLSSNLQQMSSSFILDGHKGNYE